MVQRINEKIKIVKRFTSKDSSFFRFSHNNNKIKAVVRNFCTHITKWNCKVTVKKAVLPQPQTTDFDSTQSLHSKDVLKSKLYQRFITQYLNYVIIPAYWDMASSSVEKEKFPLSLKKIIFPSQ